jgi:uncharacterized membrane protein YfcA
MDSLADGALLAGAAAAAGAVNAVAGGGTLLSFPALLGTMDARAANATSTVALWPGSVAAVAGYREELKGSRPFVLGLLWPSLLGGAAGAVLVFHTDEAAFRAVVPWLVLFATALFAASERIGAWCVAGGGAGEAARPGARAWLFQFAVAVYGGYFGAGIGVLMLAALSILGLRDIHRMNGMKTVLGTAVNGIAVAVFSATGLVRWPEALLMAVAAAAGGYLGARVGRRIPRGVVRGLVILSGLAVAGKMLLA